MRQHCSKRVLVRAECVVEKGAELSVSYGKKFDYLGSTLSRVALFRHHRQQEKKRFQNFLRVFRVNGRGNRLLRGLPVPECLTTLVADEQAP